MEAEGAAREQVSTDASLALDEAEAKAVAESRQAQAIAGEPLELAGSANEHIETARRNVEDILREEAGACAEVKSPGENRTDPPEGPMRLKEAMDDMTREDAKPGETSGIEKGKV